MSSNATYARAKTASKAQGKVALAYECALDIRPSSDVKSEVLRDLMRHMIDKGIDAEERIIATDLLPSSTFSQNVQKHAEADAKLICFLIEHLDVL